MQQLRSSCGARRDASGYSNSAAEVCAAARASYVERGSAGMASHAAVFRRQKTVGVRAVDGIAVCRVPSLFTFQNKHEIATRVFLAQ